MHIQRRYTLTAEEIEKATQLGRARCEAKPEFCRFNDSDFHSDNPDRAFPHILGVYAEIAYANLTGKHLDEQIHTSGDNWDFDGIEIKASKWLGSDIELKVKQSEYSRKIPRGYVLARLFDQIHTVMFIGSINRKRFDEIKEEKTHKAVVNWIIKAKDLTAAIPVINDSKLQLLHFD